MYQFDLISNLNTKKTNRTSTAKATAKYAESEFSYNDVLYDEVSRMSSQRRRYSSNNNSRYSNNTRNNTAANLSLLT